jgi:hypothetical protein
MKKLLFHSIGIHSRTQRDLVTLGSRPNVDRYEQFLRTLLSNAVGKDVCAQISVTFPMMDSAQVCVIRVPAAAKPVYVNEGANQYFFVRSGNTTQSLNIEEAHAYCRTRFR